MRPLKIIINGDYWDSQIYRGRLYLWHMDGTLSIYDWDGLINNLSERSNNQLALLCAFARGDYFYRNDWSLVFQDNDIKALIQSKFESTPNIYLSVEDMRGYLYGKQNNPFDELATDTEIYNSTLFAITYSGLWKSTAHRNNRRYPISSKPVKLWDCPLYSIKASKNRLALAAGNQGLYEYQVNYDFFEEDYNNAIVSYPKEIERGIYRINDAHSSLANWSFASIYSSSFINSSYLSAFGWDNRKRIFKKSIQQSEIFEEPGFSWGVQDKIYKVSTNGLDVVRFVQKHIGTENERDAFQNLGRITFQSWKGKIIGGGVSYFGSIVECENALVLLQSDGNIYNIEGPVTRWRVFPRSERYENQLHVIKSDCLEIYSFNHDYFVNQQEKRAGIRYNVKNIRMRPNTFREI